MHSDRVLYPAPSHLAMISLLYHSHTVVPAHLAELETLDILEYDEHVLVALDGVLLDGAGNRLSGPTLHDYCLITSLRIILWARDYGRHLCCAFPLAELVEVQGNGLDPLHAQIQLRFVAPGEEDQRFILTLLPLADLQPGLTLLRAASDTARRMLEEGYDAHGAGPEVIAVLSEQIFGHADGPRPGATPYRWLDAPPGAFNAPLPAFYQDPASLPPGQVYAAGRLARSAWDALRRSLREADLPFDLSVLSNGGLRDLADAVRAINELVHTVASNPMAQQMALSLLGRQHAGGASSAASAATESAASPPEPVAIETPPRTYREIPLRRRNAQPPAEPAPASETGAIPATALQDPSDAAPQKRQETQPTFPDRREIPLRRRSAARTATPAYGSLPAARSGSGDASQEERTTTDERRQSPSGRAEPVSTEN